MPLVKILALIMIVSVMLGAGLEVDRQRLVETLRQYGLLARAFLGNIVLVPLFALLLVRFFHPQSEIATGIVLMAMAPGVPFLVNIAGKAAGGSLSFAITLTFYLTAISVVTIPLTIWLISLAIPSAPVPPVPAARFLTTLVSFQLVPLVAGALIGPRLPPAAAAKAVKILHFAFLAAALVFIVLIFPILVDSITKVYGNGNFLIIAAIALFSIAIGWLFGGADEHHRRTLSIATLMRNIGLCLLIGTGPMFEKSLVVPAIFAYFAISFVFSLPLRALFKRKAGAPA